MRMHYVRRTSKAPLAARRRRGLTRLLIGSLALSLGAIVAVSAHAQTAKSQTPAGKAPGVATADALFIRAAGEAGKAEMDLAQLAMNKSRNADVKAFAEALRNDHQKTNTDLAELADRKGVTIAQTTASAKAIHAKLTAMSGAEFDNAFLAQMVSDHDKAVSDFTKASKNTKDADIQAFTDKTLPALKDHLARAKDLKSKSVETPAADTLKDRIAYRLETSPVTKKYDIKVKVDAGVATLSGSVATAAQRTEAGRLASVSGVSRVDNQIKVDPDADKTLTERAKNGMSRTGEAITDAWITTKVKWFYLGDEALKGSSINVDTSNRVVTLNGSVPSAAARTRAIDLANDTDGVLKVVDHLKIAGSK